MKRRMLAGELYIAGDASMEAEHARAQELLDRYNRITHAERGERDRVEVPDR